MFMIESDLGQEAGIRTRTVRFTGGDAAVTPQSWKDTETQRAQVAESQGILCGLGLRDFALKTGALTWIRTTNLLLRTETCTSLTP